MGMAGYFLKCFRVVVHAPEVIAIRHWRECSIQWKHFHAVTAEFEVTDDLGPQQRHDVRGDGILESRKYLFRDRSTAENVALLEHEHLLACPREVCRTDQTVVAPTDDDDVIFHLRDLPI